MTKFEEISKYIQKKYVIGSSQKIPGENELAKKFKCSRATISNALKILKNMGFVYSKKGVGWFIAKNGEDVFIKSLSETIDYDSKKIEILDHKKIDNKFKEQHIISVKYSLKGKQVASLLLFVSKNEIKEIKLDQIKKTTNNIYKNKNISSISYEVILELSEFDNIINRKILDSPIVKFEILSDSDKLISFGYIFERKDNFSFKVIRGWT